MKRLVAGLAFLSSVAAFLVVVGGGLALFAIESSGERGAGAAMAVSGSLAFAAAMVLIFAGEGVFSDRRSAWAIIAALLGLLPVAALSIGALRFSGFPISGAVPAVAWPIFALGVVLALGAVSVLMVGYWRWKGPPPVRSAPRAAPIVERPAVVMWPPDQPGRAVASEAAPRPGGGLRRPALRPPPAAYDDEEDIRVTPVDLPALGRFRQR